MTQTLQTQHVTTTRTIVLWIAIQLAAILVAIAGIHFGRQSGDVDRDALSMLLTIELVASALLADVLTRDWYSAIAMVLAPIVFIQLAAAVGATPGSTTARVAIAMTSWLIAIACWQSCARDVLMRITISTILSCLTIGGVALLYLREEFGNGGGQSHEALFGPVMSMCTLADSSAKLSDVHLAWGFVVIACASGVVAAGIARVARRRD